MRTGGGDALTFASEGGSEEGSDSDTSDWNNKVSELCITICSIKLQVAYQGFVH